MNSEESPHAEALSDPSQFATRSSMIRDLKAMSPERWENFVRVYTPLMAFWVRKKRVPAAAVDDVIQNSLQSVCKGIGQFERDVGRGRFRGWLRRIVERRAADFLRKTPEERLVANQQLQDTPAADQKAPEELESEEQAMKAVYARALEIARQSTTERTWQMFWEREVENVPTAEVAKKFNVSSAAVRVNVQRVKARMAELLFHDFGEKD